MIDYAVIEAETIPERYARGWHCLGLQVDFTEAPRKIEAFGTELVAYRGESGALRVSSAFCPHMGGNLCDGWVEGESIRCAFHSWRWGADGVCDHIPYAKKIPEKARIRSYEVLEENQFVFIWHDPEGSPPIPEQRPPHMSECDSDEWTDWVIETKRIETNCRELVDNMSDKAHFAPVHGAGARVFKNTFHKHTCVQFMQGESARLSEDDVLTTEATYYGPAYMITVMQGQMEGMPVDTRLLVAHVPVTTESFDLHFGVMMKKTPGLDDATNAAIIDEYIKLSQESFAEDVVIWQNKVRVDNPILCDGDGPINRLRKWYDQFYVDIADVPTTWNNAKEYTVDAYNPIPTQRLEETSK
ncbi:MAG: Rieske 2Fe-2S domain-containing protein [Pseudomonadota bacterium]